jgi:hypothetical protein
MGVEVPSWVEGDGKDVVSELDKSQESAASPSRHCSPSGVKKIDTRDDRHVHGESLGCFLFWLTPGV